MECLNRGGWGGGAGEVLSGMPKQWWGKGSR